MYKKTKIYSNNPIQYTQLNVYKRKRKIKENRLCCTVKKEKVKQKQNKSDLHYINLITKKGLKFFLFSFLSLNFTYIHTHK